MKKSVITIFLFLISSLLVAQPKDINIITPEWENYSQKDGKGLYHDLFNLIYKNNGIKINVEYAPFKRCEANVKNKASDAYPGGYLRDSDIGIIPKWHIGLDLLTVACRKGEVTTWKGQEIMKGKKVSWARGYDFDTYGVVTVPVEKNEYDALENALKMLDKKRLDFILDYEQDLNKQIKNLNLTDRIVIYPNAINGPKFFMVFVKNDKGKELAQIWDREMEKLANSGKLKALYQKYNEPTY